MRYFFHLKTDEDFGLRIRNKDFLSEIKIRAHASDIANMLENSELIETNPSKTEMVRDFLEKILAQIVYFGDGFQEGGNWEVRFFPLFDDEKDFDFDF